MVDALLDTATIVDFLRGYSVAVDWISKSDQMLGVTKFTWLEIVEGCENKRSLTKAIALVERFELVEVSITDIDWALERLLQLNLSHNIDPFDCLIAATAHRLQLTLYTRNLKHFTPLLGSLAQTPY